MTSKPKSKYPPKKPSSWHSTLWGALLTFILAIALFYGIFHAISVNLQILDIDLRIDVLDSYYADIDK